MDDNEQIFDEKGFIPTFLTDVSNARGLVLIKSTYLAANRIAKMLPTFQRCMVRGVHFVAFVQDPNGKYDNDQAREKLAVTKAAASMLTSAGILLIYLPKIHQKLAIIDDEILWSGCLNILSFNDTYEEMTRYLSRWRVKDAIARHKLVEHASRDGRAPEWFLSEHKDDGAALRSFGKYIIARRQELNMSQQKLASLADVRQATLSQVETGAIDARLTTVARICRVLECKVRPVPSFLEPCVASALFSKEPETTDIRQSV